MVPGLWWESSSSSRPSRGSASQLAQQGHGLFAVRAQRGGNGRGALEGRRGPIQEGQHAPPFLFGSGTQKAEVANALEAAGQDVLEEAMQEGLRRERGRLELAGVIAKGEGEVLAVVGDDALGAQSGAVNVSGQVFEGGFAAANGL